MAVIDAGHYGVEHIFIADMEHFCRRDFQRQRDPDSKDPAAILGFDVRCLGAGRKQTDLSKRRKRQKEGGKYGTADVQSTD